MIPSEKARSGFSLAETVLGIGLSAALILTLLVLTTAALNTDSKTGHHQAASALAESELDRLVRSVSILGSSARSSFWNSPDGEYSGPPTQNNLISGNTEYNLKFFSKTLSDASGTELGIDSPRNRLRKVDVEVSWWSGEEGRPGYGQLSVTRTRLVRESDLRD